MIDALEQQPGAHEQHERESDLGHDQHSSGTPIAAGCPRGAFPGSLVQIVADRTDCRENSRNHANDRRDEESEREHGSVKPNGSCARELGWAERHDRMNRHFGDEHAEHATCQREREALGEHLSCESHAAGAKRGAHGELASPLRAAGEHEIRDVHADDGQHEQHRHQHRDEHWSDASCDVRLERAHIEPIVQRCPGHTRKFLHRRTGNARELGLCLLHLPVRREPGHEAQVMPPLATLRAERQFVLERRPYVGERRQHVLEVARHDADYFEIRVVELDAAPDDASVAAEPSLPECIAQDDDVRAIGNIVRRLEGAPDRGHDAERLEEIRAHTLTRKSLRLARTHHDRLPGADRSHVRERMRAMRDLEVRAEGDVERLTVGAPIRDHERAVASAGTEVPRKKSD